jgi:putative ABC transport system permease protein
MSDKRISTARIAVSNIVHQRFRSVCIVLLIALTTLLIAGGTLLGVGLQNGVESIDARLGADAMIIPLSADSDFEGALLNGSPSTFYLPPDAMERLDTIEGVERATGQLFISTFDSEHCAALLQIIGYDPETDFVVKPWLASSEVTEPENGEVIVGSNVTLDVGDKLQLFALNLEIVGKLDKTGMGFDNSVFVNRETAHMLLGEYEKYAGAFPLPEGEDGNDVVSAILLDVDNSFDPVVFQRSVNEGFRGEGVRYVSSQALMASTSKNLGLVLGVLAVLLSALWVFAVFVLAVIFTLTLNERQREFGVLQALGATRGKLASIVLSEVALLCAGGALIGIGVVCLIVFPYSSLIESVLQTAYLPPRSLTVSVILGSCFVAGTAIGPLASLFSLARIGRSEVYENMREGL